MNKITRSVNNKSRIEFPANSAVQSADVEQSSKLKSTICTCIVWLLSNFLVDFWCSFCFTYSAAKTDALTGAPLYYH